MEVVASFLGLAKRDCVVYTTNLEHSNALLQHLGYLQISVISAHNGVNRRFVNDQVEYVALKLPHIGHVHR